MTYVFIGICGAVGLALGVWMPWRGAWAPRRPVKVSREDLENAIATHVQLVVGPHVDWRALVTKIADSVEEVLS